MKRKRTDIYNYICEKTLDAINQSDFKYQTTDAQSISIDLKMNRSNVSRTLNQLFDSRQLVKVKGRPTLFFSSELLLSHYWDMYLPSEFKNIHEFDAFIQKHSLIDSRYSFQDIIGKEKGESLYGMISSVRSSILYPLPFLFSVVHGKSGTGKTYILKSINRFLAKKHRIKSVYFDLRETALSFNEQGELIEHILNTIRPISDLGLFLDNLDSLPEAIWKRLLYEIFKLRKDRRYLTNKSQIFASMDTSNFKEHSAYFSREASATYFLPPYNQRSLRERISLVINAFYLEAHSIHKNIRLEYSTVYSLSKYNYTYNMHSLNQIIKSILIDAYPQVLDSNNNQIILSQIDFSGLNLSVFKKIINDPVSGSYTEELLDYLSNGGQFIIYHNTPPHMIQGINSMPMAQNFSTDERVFSDPIINASLDFKNALSTNEISNYLGVYYCNNLFSSYPDYITNIATKLNLKLHTFISNRHANTLRYTNFVFSNNETEQLVKSLEAEQKASFNYYELSYINKYISLALNYLNRLRIGVLIISNLSITGQEIYRTNRLENYDNVKISELSLIDYSHSKKTFEEKILRELDDIDEGKGLLIISDIELPYQLRNIIACTTHNSVWLKSDFSSKSLMQIINFSVAKDSILELLPKRFLIDMELFDLNTHFESFLIQKLNNTLSLLNPELLLVHLINSTNGIFMDNNICIEENLNIYKDFIIQLGISIEQYFVKKPKRSATIRIEKYRDIDINIRKHLKIFSTLYNINIQDIDTTALIDILANLN